LLLIFVSVGQSDHFDLYQAVKWQLGNLEAGACRWFAFETGAIDFINFGKIAEIF